MKKLMILVLTSLFVLVGCSSNNIMKDYAGLKTEDHHFFADSPEDFIEDLENRVEGVYFMGFSDCPWCKELVPVLDEIASEQGHSIQYLNTRSSGFQNNTTLQNRLQAWIETLPEADQNGGSVPFTIFIDKDGNVITHLGTVESHNAPTATMTENEMKFLVARLTEKFATVSPEAK